MRFFVAGAVLTMLMYFVPGLFSLAGAREYFCSWECLIQMSMVALSLWFYLTTQVRNKEVQHLSRQTQDKMFEAGTDRSLQTLLADFELDAYSFPEYLRVLGWMGDKYGTAEVMLKKCGNARRRKQTETEFHRQLGLSPEEARRLTTFLIEESYSITVRSLRWGTHPFVKRKKDLETGSGNEPLDLGMDPMEGAMQKLPIKFKIGNVVRSTKRYFLADNEWLWYAKTKHKLTTDARGINLSYVDKIAINQANACILEMYLMTDDKVGLTYARVYELKCASPSEAAAWKDNLRRRRRRIKLAKTNSVTVVAPD